MSNYNTKDALGDEIQIGALYGYSASSSGVTHVKLGTAKKFTPKGLITLEVTKHTSALYMNDAEVPRYAQEVGKTISVKPLMLFPVK